MFIIITLIVVGVSAYVWCLRGFFSALLHLACVLVAGAIAFGLWEPVGYLLLGSSPDRGAFSFMSGVAWAAALVLPFVIILAILRAAVDKILPANAQCETTVDYVGGGICGLASGVICAGILVLSLLNLRLGSDAGGYQPVAFTSGTGRGSLETSKETWAPWADRLTADVYSRLSLTTLRTGEPLAKWHPDLVSEAGATRLTYEDSSRNTLKPDSFRLLGWYTVGNTQQGDKMDALLADSWNEIPQKATDLTGEPYGQGYLAGFVLMFKSTAREKTGQVIVGNGQVRLVVQSTQDEDDTKAIHPVAVITNVDDSSRIEYARFRFDGDKVFFTSIGGGSETPMAFEFPIPRDYKPIALYVKGARIEIDENSRPVNYESPSARDEMVRAGQMMGMGGVGPILDANGNPVQGAAQTNAPNVPPIVVSNTMGFSVQKGTEGGGVTLAEAESGRGWTVQEGEIKIDPRRALGFSTAVPPNLRIDRFATTNDTAIVKVEFSPSNRREEFLQQLDKADKSKPPVLVDNNGTRYEPVGFMYTDSTEKWVRYTKGNPIHSLQELPAISRSSPDRKLILVYSVSVGVQIMELRIGDVVLEKYESPPVKVESRQR